MWIFEKTNILAAKLNNPSGPPAPPPPPMDWPHPQGNPRMVRLRKFEPGRVPGTLKKSEMEQVRKVFLNLGVIFVDHEELTVKKMELFIRENHKVWPKVVLFGITVQQLINLQARLFYAILLSRGLLQTNILLLIFKDHINQSKFSDQFLFK